ncbi:hypothetical protein C2845_PM03G25230 [Panicum miliaceum]|uniref:Uncharacterized protein n=1 Tax=Panicum miliaceum TaxID=4540 RepID=A0A3L6T6Q5_PANMI|nr:hypothetical protein C2845_PM03G25230 [Panicum miliaceum]
MERARPSPEASGDSRGVFKDFEKKMVDCTAYNIEEDKIEGKDCYLITHTNRSSKISWGQHQFRCSEGEDVNDEDQRNEMNAAESDHVVAGGGAVLDVMGPSNEHGMRKNKRKMQLDDSSYGAEANAIDDSMISRVPPPRAKPKG